MGGGWGANQVLPLQKKGGGGVSGGGEKCLTAEGGRGHNKF